jgi:hypothetical protein
MLPVRPRKSYLSSTLLPCLFASGVCGALISCGTSPSTDTGTVKSCTETCVPHAPSGWIGPALLWSGPKEKAPGCPAATNILYEGNADLVASNDCAACTCGPSSGLCSPATTISLYMSEVSCQPSPMVTSFDAPPGWDGSCSADDWIPKSSFNTATIGPHHLTDDACYPGTVAPEVTAPPPAWQTYAFACEVEGSSQCGNGDSCIDFAEPSPEGFGLCIFHEGVETCPEAYPFQHVFYEGIDDGRACSACKCGPPEGSDCIGMFFLYADSECKNVVLGIGVVSNDTSTACSLSDDPFPAPWPITLGSKSAPPPTYKPGTCAPSGGEPTGSAAAMGPTTFCCRDGS